MLTRSERESLNRGIGGIEDWVLDGTKEGKTHKGEGIKIAFLHVKGHRGPAFAAFAAFRNGECVGVRSFVQSPYYASHVALDNAFNGSVDFEVSEKSRGIGSCLTAEALHYAAEHGIRRVDTQAVNTGVWRDHLVGRMGGRPLSRMVSWSIKDDFGARKYKAFMLKGD